MLTVFTSIFRKPKNIIALLIGSLIIFFILRVLPIYEILHNSYKIPGISFQRKQELFFDYTLGSFLDIPVIEQVLVISLSLFTVINLILFIVFARRQRKILSKRSFIASVSGMFLGLFGVGCLSCGALIMAPLLTFIGFGAYLGSFAEYALWISITGVLFVLFSIFYLLKKISEPMIC